jgi:hypothetical protein
MSGSLHRERSPQTAHSALMAPRASCMAPAVPADPLRRTTTRAERGSRSSVFISRKCLEHLPVRVPNRARKSASTSAIAGVGICNINPPQKHPVREKKHGDARFGESIYGYFSRQSAALKRVQRGGCFYPHPQLSRTFSVGQGQRLQPLLGVVVCQFFNLPSRQKQPQAHRKGRVGGLHLSALSNTPSVGASQP